jgi:hypothetical protein
MTSREQAFKSVLRLRTCYFSSGWLNIIRYYHHAGRIDAKERAFEQKEAYEEFIRNLAKGRIEFVADGYQLIPYRVRHIRELTGTLSTLGHRMYNDRYGDGDTANENSLAVRRTMAAVDVVWEEWLKEWKILEAEVRGIPEWNPLESHSSPESDVSSKEENKS